LTSFWRDSSQPLGVFFHVSLRGNYGVHGDGLGAGLLGIGNLRDHAVADRAGGRVAAGSQRDFLDGHSRLVDLGVHGLCHRLGLFLGGQRLSLGDGVGPRRALKVFAKKRPEVVKSPFMLAAIILL
jgi:hypothetical protein